MGDAGIVFILLSWIFSEIPQTKVHTTQKKIAHLSSNATMMRKSVDSLANVSTTHMSTTEMMKLTMSKVHQNTAIHFRVFRLKA